jgi:hypothetical protein
MSERNPMTDLDHYLTGCDAALADAERLVACLVASGNAFEPELSATREGITALRREVEGLRGMKSAPGRRNIRPKRMDFPEAGLPWPTHRPPGTDD